jgi:MFS family permease
MAILAAALLPSWAGWAVSNLLLGWMTFDLTRSAVLVAFAFALRLVPFAVVGLPAGVISDRLGRTTVFVGANVLATAGAVGIAVSALSGPSVPQLLALSALLGVADAARLVAGANLAYDIGGESSRVRNIAFVNLTAGIGQVGGALVGGYLLARSGAATTGLINVCLYVIGTAPMLFLRHPIPARSGARIIRQQMRESVILLVRHDAITALVALTLIVEIFGFSCMSLDPIFAGAVFAAGPIGLGVIAGSRSLGRLFGSFGLAVRAPARATPSLVWIVAVFGGALAGFALAPTFLVAVAMVGVSGLAGGVVDALEQTAFQDLATEDARGQAIGLWVITLGFGSIGIAGIGALAQVIGPRAALAVSGLVVVAAGLALRANLTRAGTGRL